MTLGVSDVGAVRYRIPHHHHRNTTMGRIKSDPLHRKTKRPKESHQRFGFTRDLRLPDNLALRVHNVHAREFQSHVDSGKVLHAVLRLQMLGADSTEAHRRLGRGRSGRSVPEPPVDPA